jgi:dihydroorotase
MTLSLTLPKWFDAHTHLRQEGLLAPIVKSQLDMGCYAILAMPNTRPIVGNIDDNHDNEYWSINDYRTMIMDAGGDAFDHVFTPLYLHKGVTPKMMEAGAQSGVLKSIKYYPPHGTTNADHGVAMDDLLSTDIFKAMSDNGVILNIHGEDHGLKSTDYFDRNTNAEDVFYREKMPRLIERYPDLKIVCEHVTTKTAVDFVTGTPDHIGATITPQHLLYTIGDLILGLKYHLFCLPVLKFAEDRAALLDAVTKPSQTKFFAGTDSAAHTVKATDCGCAAGCFTGGIAPQLYAQAFEDAGMDLSRVDHEMIFKNFLCHNAPDFYKINRSTETFTMSKTPQTLSKIPTGDGEITPLPIGLGQATVPWSIID